MNKKKIRLTYDENPDFYILGISSFDKDYRLIWNVNNSLGFQFVRTDNHVAFDKKKNTELDFPVTGIKMRTIMSSIGSLPINRTMVSCSTNCGILIISC